MMKMLLFLSVLFAGAAANAQESLLLRGKLKVIEGDNGVVYNYNTGSSSVSKEFSDPLAGQKDRVEGVARFFCFYRVQ